MSDEPDFAGMVTNMSNLDPELIFRINRTQAQVKFWQALATTMSLGALIFLAAAVPLVVMAWRAAF